MILETMAPFLPGNIRDSLPKKCYFCYKGKSVFIFQYEQQAIARSRAANSRKEVESKATLGLQPQLQNSQMDKDCIR